ncbi:beta-D-xylosidase 1-like [Zingiber officinale]|uniref:Fibronectin type III-like domain-containing protein n=1 Tax=Zingiber officinale TaxID=94328 RepID=A0A8J5GG59_ZINOF|nr:beta-D-xylosidase 1-like [Zingiber officinale]KAG6505220.1 hypothetical protein ZIOFF_037574 [Zingiber officinale]
MAISPSSLFPSLLLVVALAASALVGGGSAAFACGRGSPAAGLPFCQPGLPIRARARDLIGRLTVAEKVAMLVSRPAGVPRLGIPSYQWWSEALHGVAKVGDGVHFGGEYPAATSFPQVISSAASFNASLWELMGKVVSDEARALYNGLRAGLTYWSPNVNIYRDPRWGRGQETPGEDPAVSARYAVAYVRGLQQPSGGARGFSRLKVAACCKHYTAYDLDNWNGYDRFHFNAKVSKQDLEDTYNVPFKACVVDGKVASVMCSYNQVNGVPSCADPNLRRIVRGQWRLNGYIVSDCDSVSVFYNEQHYGSRPEDAAAYALKAGMDLECGGFLGQYAESALRQGKVSEADIDFAVTHTVAVQMRLGMFEGDNQPFRDLGPRDLCSGAHQSLALEAARQAIVLLKNRAGALPLSPSRLRTVAVIGPNSDATTTMIGNYAGIPCAYTSPLKGISSYVKTVHAVGCTGVACAREQPIDAAVEVARHADAVVLVVGLDQSIEAEGRDRLDLLLPGRQQELVTAVAKASPGPTVLVIMSGSPVDVSFAEVDPNIAAILWVGYPGQAGGAAIADVIFGAYNPGGKLPVTWYPQSYVDRVPMTNMAMRPNPSTGYPGRTYRFYTGPVVYPFGHGLSYSKFTHTLALAPSQLSVQLVGSRTEQLNSTLNRAVRVNHARCDGLAVPVNVDVANAGDRDGAHTVLVYWRPPAGHAAATRQLVAFEKVHVPAGNRVSVALVLDVCTHLTVADAYGIRRIPMGEHSLEIGELTHTFLLEADTLPRYK